MFHFRYPDTLINCMPLMVPQNSNASSTSPSQSIPIQRACMIGQDETCDGPGSGGTTKACFAYPNKKFGNDSSFIGATLYVSEIESDKTETACLKGSQNWLVIKPGTSAVISHIAFKKFEIGDNWMSGGKNGPAYRTFHNRKCYELGIQAAFSRAVYDGGPAKDLTHEQWSEIESTLNQPLNSFEFLK